MDSISRFKYGMTYERYVFRDPNIDPAYRTKTPENNVEKKGNLVIGTAVIDLKTFEIKIEKCTPFYKK